MNDLYNQKFRTDTVLGVEMHIMIYNYNYTYPNSTKNAIFYDVKVNKKTLGKLDSFIFSMFLDPDLGYFYDDLLGCQPSSNSIFTYNGDNFDEPSFNGIENYGNNPPVFVSSFIRPKMNSWWPYFNFAGWPIFTPPHNTIPYLGLDTNMNPFSGNPSNLSDRNNMLSMGIIPRDFKYIQNTGVVKLNYNQPLNYEFVLYTHQYKEYNARPNIYDSVLIPLESIKKGPISKECNISFSATITPTTDHLKNGRIQLESIIASKPFLAKWSSLETTEILNNKDSGKYRVVIIDANNCMKDSAFYIPLITKGTAEIAETRLDNIFIFPNPIENQLTIKNPNQLKIENVSIYDVVGKLVYQTTLNSKNETSDLGLKTLPRGNYLMYITTGHGVKNFKITK